MRPPWTFSDPEGVIHVVGPVDLSSVLRALRYRAAQLGSPAPTQLTEDDIEQACMRPDEHGENLVPCSPDDPAAVMVTRWLNRPPATGSP
jgi:hypothetical protein